MRTDLILFESIFMADAKNISTNSVFALSYFSAMFSAILAAEQTYDFSYGGVRLNENETPDGLGMEDRDSIDAVRVPV